MNPNFQRSFEAVVGVEGVYSTDPHDKGNYTGGEVGVGELRGTKYGISAAAYPTLDIAALSVEDARDIYFRDYWTRARCDIVPAPADLMVFDGAVNQGVAAVVVMMQQAVGVAADGLVGVKTIPAIKAADGRKLALEVAARRAVLYANGNGEYFLGWYRRLVSILAECLEK